MIMARLLAAVLVAALTPSFASAQVTALVQGQVADETKAVLPGASVTARNTDTGFSRTVTTDERGLYRIAALPPGPYELVVELTGFTTVERRGLEFNIGQEATINVQLQLVTVQETVTVTGEAPLIETTKTTLGSTITPQKLDSLPLAERDYRNLVTLAVGVSQDGGAAGMGNPDVRNSGRVGYQVDGVSQENNLTVGSRGNLASDSVQEFQVLTNMFTAEYGTASGPIVNILTRSGTNDLRGRFSFFTRNNELDARPFFATGEAPFSQQFYSGFVGGPVVRDRMHYFGSAEGLRQDQTVVVTARALPGEYPNEQRGIKVLTRLDAQLTTNNRLSFRYNIDKSKTTNSGVGGLNTIERGRISQPKRQDFQVTWNTILSSTALNELRVQYAPLVSNNREQNCPGCPAISRPGGNFGKARNMPQAFTEDRAQVVNHFSWTQGNHNFKAGVDFSYIWTDIFFPNTQDGEFTFETDRAFDAADPTTYPVRYDLIVGDPNLKVPDKLFNTFIQDSWRVGSKLTINAGLRYEWQGQYGVSQDKNNFGPRLGFTWDPQGRGDLLIRGGAGLYYDRNRGELALFALQSAQNFTRIRILNPGYPDAFGFNPNGTSEGQAPRPSITVIDPNKVVTNSKRATVGIVKALTRTTRVTSDFVWVRGDNVLRNRDINPVVDDATGRRLDPNFGPITQQESTAKTRYYGLETELSQQLYRNVQFTFAYTLSYSEHDLDDPISQLNFAEAMSRQGNRHVMSGGGIYQLPFGLQVGVLFRARSGDFYSILTGRDSNRDGFTTERPPTEARQAHVGPWMWTMDTRITKAFSMGSGRRLELIAEAFNAANRPGFDTPENRLTSANFGRFVEMDDAYDPRQVQLGLRFSF
jgi:hypothetical protein